MELVEPKGDRWRIVTDLSPQRRRLFEAVIPPDSTDAEIEIFARELKRILRQRRAGKGTHL